MVVTPTPGLNEEVSKLMFEFSETFLFLSYDLIFIPGWLCYILIQTNPQRNIYKNQNEFNLLKMSEKGYRYN